MLVLLPPSETKRAGGVDRASTTPELWHAAALADTRADVRSALVELCADEDAAAKALKLGAKARGELAYNLRLDTAPLLPAGERYTGVLYDALDVGSLDAAAREWFDAHVAIQSALFGLISVADLIPAYRLSGSSRVPGLATTLKRAWRAAHQKLDWSAAGWVLDLRSKDYAELAPLPDGVGVSLQVAQRGADGAVRALNHFNKAAKGDLVRRLSHSAPELASAADFAAWGHDTGLDVQWDANEGVLTLVTDLGAPADSSVATVTTAAASTGVGGGSAGGRAAAR